MVKIKFREIDLFEFTSSLARTFLNFLAHCMISRENSVFILIIFFRSHTDGVTCLQFNDFYIVSGSYDKTVKLWDFTVCWYNIFVKIISRKNFIFYIRILTIFQIDHDKKNDNIVLYTLNLGCFWIFWIPSLHNQHFWHFFECTEFQYALLI